jgi:hypothetical protein
MLCVEAIKLSSADLRVALIEKTADCSDVQMLPRDNEVQDVLH